MLSHFALSPVACIIIWVDDNPVEEALVENEKFAAVISTTPKLFSDFIKKIKSFFESPEKLLKFPGRIRIAVNSESPDLVLKSIRADLPYDSVVLDIIVNRELIDPQMVEDLSNIRKDFTLSSGTIGFINFVKMATLLWIGKVDEALISAFNKNGIVVHVCKDLTEASSWIKVRFYLWKSLFFRILIIQETNEMDLDSFLSDIRITCSCNAPVLILLKNLKEFSAAIFEYPFVKATTDDKEPDSFGIMMPLTWA